MSALIGFSSRMFRQPVMPPEAGEMREQAPYRAYPRDEFIQNGVDALLAL
jgi:hypothetical protein